MSTSERKAYLLGSLVAFVMGGVMLAYYLTGLLAKYLDTNFRDHCLIAGVVLIIIGLFNLLTLGRRAGSSDHEDCGHCDDDQHHHDHGERGHGHDEKGRQGNHERDEADSDHHHAFFGGESMTSTVIATFMICGTVSYAAFFSPHEFSPQAIMNKGLYRPGYEASRADKSLARSTGERASTQGRSGRSQTTDPGKEGEEMTTSDIGAFSLADLEAQVDRDAEGYFELEVPELYYTAGDLEVRRVLEGQPVVTIAQAMPEKFNNPDGTRVRIFRIFIECCAADARPLAIPVEFGKTPPEFQEMGWVKVKGHMAYRLEDGSTVPILLAEEMLETEEPEQTMMY